MKKVALLLLFHAFIKSGFAQRETFDVNEMMNETQIVSDEPDRMRLIWWIPTEYWAASLAQDPDASSEVENIVAVLKDYTVFAIADGEVGTFGSVNYVPLEEIKTNLTITDRHGDVFKPLDDKDVNQDTRLFLQMMRPVFANMLGAMGENMHFILFRHENLEGKRLLDPYVDGTFSIQLFKEVMTWETPLGSFLEPKKCPVDGKTMSGAWNYCPKHGKLLEEN